MKYDSEEISLSDYNLLPDKFKNSKNLITCCIYSIICETADTYHTILQNSEIEKIKEVVLNLYENDDFFNLSEEKIGESITECYIDNKNFLNRISEMDEFDILDHIVQEREMEL